MKIILLLGGRGFRFEWVGYTTPKHLLLLPDGRPLLAHVLECYRPLSGSFLVPIRAEYLTAELSTLFPAGTTFYPLLKPTDGPTESIAFNENLMEDLRSSYDEVVVADCDSFLDGHELIQGLFAMRQKATAGSFIRATTDSGCAFVHVGMDGYATEIREKDPFTSTSITGPYWWTTTHAFLKDLEIGRQSGALSIAPLMNFRLKRLFKSVWLAPTKTFQHLGTPEAYETYLINHRPSLQSA